MCGSVAPVHVHEAVRYEALVQSIARSKSNSRGGAAAEAQQQNNVKAEPFQFGQAVAAAAQYKQETEAKQRSALSVSDDVASSAAEDESASPFAAGVRALATGDAAKQAADIDWAAFVAEKQQWPRIPQLPLF